jgi:hypothetical protein
MAKSIKNGLITLDAQGQGFDQQIEAQAIMIRASADAWAVTLTDRDGTARFMAGNSQTGNRGFPTIFSDDAGIKFDGIVLSAATNITAVMIVFKPIQL